MEATEIEDEIWAPVKGYPDYAISNYGRLRNLTHNREVRGSVAPYGGLKVSLSRGGEVQDFYIHHLVAQAFISGWRPGIRVRHLDNDRTNNYHLNLRFMGYGLGQYRPRQPELKVREVMVVETGQIYGSVRECAQALGTTPHSIYRVLRGKRETHLGFTFQYFEETI